MRKTLKNLFFFCLLICIVLSFSACSKMPNGNKKTVLKFSSWGSESEIKILKPILKDFEEQNPDIKVEFVHIPKNYFQKLHLLIASNLSPDVMFLNNFNGPVYAVNGVLEDLNPYLKSNGQINEGDFFEKSLKAFNYNNQLYAVPRDVSNLVVYYNKDLFNKSNVPYPASNWTFNDYLSVSTLLTKDFNNDGKVDQFGSGFEKFSLFWMPFLWSNGGGIVSEDLQSVIINRPESIEALQFYSDLRNKYHVAPTASQQGSATTAQMFMQGKIAMIISGRWSVPRFRQEIKFNWDIARFPRGKAGSVVDADTSGWAMSRDSDHKEQAWRLIQFLASKKSCESFTKSGLIVPARKDVAYSSVFIDGKNPKSSKIYVDIIPESIPTPANENYQEIMDIINTDLESLWSGKKTANEVVSEEMINRIQKLLK